jgi:2-polyprenyl-3-methyl-5-hydroxy-6-metoxy-1,4-benzoquinol methylase
MSVSLDHPEGSVRIDNLACNKNHVSIYPADPSLYVLRQSCETSYPTTLIQEILQAKGLGALCDEILRDEDPLYVETALKYGMLGYLDADSFKGKRLLDFGCGAGSSTMVLARLFPETQIVGVELEEGFLSVARLRAEHYRLSNVRFLLSPSPDHLPSGLESFDFISFSAVFEHLLPNERRTILPQIWSLLKPGGVLFLNQTPHRFFPIEYHTTGLPLLNYLPDRLAFAVAVRFSKQVRRGDRWETLLRRGIRGATESEVLRILQSDLHNQPILLEPNGLGIHDKLDLWYAASSDNRLPTVKKIVKIIYRIVNFVSRRNFAPGLNMAIQKSGGLK